MKGQFDWELFFVKVICKKDVISTENSGIRIQYRKDQIFDAKIIANDLLIKEREGTYPLVGVRGDSASDFNLKTDPNGWDEWFNKYPMKNPF